MRWQLGQKYFPNILVTCCKKVWLYLLGSVDEWQEVQWGVVASCLGTHAHMISWGLNEDRSAACWSNVKVKPWLDARCPTLSFSSPQQDTGGKIWWKNFPHVVGCCSKAAQPFAHVEAAGGARDAPLSGDKLVSAAHSGLCFTQLSIKHVLNRSRWIILLTWTWADEQQAVKKKQQMLLFMHETPWLCRDTVICMNNTTYANVCLNTWGKVRKMQGTDIAHW